ncbi:EpsG family protein [Carnobacterium viridans]|uniref:EpsG family protein n=1 Tax=Carnobacterium viridans TaxID=174587 RepID=A0A1H0YG36_9LACT|nr:EpsG family protein [Carnobacterium viridans]UDE95153.1 EpsG family protein [Carnobacterium viridans]SDQ14068.1 EpsG family protein [Carnobacterium viridans]
MLSSLLIYGGTFSVSILFSYLYNLSKSQSKITKFFWMVLILLPVCLLASLRGDVGTDTLTYIGMYGWLKHVEIFPYALEYFSGNSDLFEPGYVFLNWVSLFIYDDPKTLFFLSTFVQMSFVWLGIQSMEKYLNPNLSLFIYYLFLFNTSLNLVRQSIAVAIVFYAFQYIVNHQFMKYLVFVLLASLFHVTALLFIVLYVFSFFAQDSKGILKAIFYFFIFSSPLVVYGIIQLATSSGLISTLGLEGYNFNFSNFGWGFLFYTLPVILPLGVFSQEMNNKIPNGAYGFLFNITLLQIPFRFITYFSTYAGRLEDYASIVQVILVSMLIHNSEEGNKQVLTVYFVLWYLLYHVITFALGNTNETYPYVLG